MGIYGTTPKLFAGLKKKLVDGLYLAQFDISLVNYGFE